MEPHYGHIFLKLPDPRNRFDDTKVRIATSSVELSGIIGAFEEYLLACGFSIDGHLEIIRDEVDDATEDVE